MGAGVLEMREPKSVTAGIRQRGQWDVIVMTVTPDQPCTTLSDRIHMFTTHSIVCSSVSRLSLVTDQFSSLFFFPYLIRD